MLVSIGRRACALCCLQRRSSPWRVLRPRAAPAPPSSSSSAACWPAVSRAYSSRTNSRNGGAATNTTSSARQNRPPATIAVLGGGVTGLTTAYYLTKFLPSARITLYEASDRLGGWVDSHTMDLRKRLPNGMPARVVCEYGPRLISPSEKNFSETLVYAELLHYLNLVDKAWTLHKPPIGSRQPDLLSRRYIYYPDHLVELPSPRFAFRTRFVRSCRILVRFLYEMVRKLATEPLLTGAPRALWRWLFSPPRAGESLTDLGASRRRKLVERLAATPDESVGDFFTAYLGGRELVDNVIAAMVHGIYGGSPWRLSVQSSVFLHTAIQDYVGLASVEKIETKANAALNEEIFLEPSDKGNAIRDLFTNGTVAYDIVRATGFLNGFSTFTNALADALYANPNVEIRLNEPVVNLGYIQAGQESSVRVKTNKTGRNYSKVISTIFAKHLADITDGRLPALADMEAVTMQVVNLYYPDQHLNHPHQGFGYLVPPTADVAPGVLGVIFDSDRDDAVADSFYYRHQAHPAGDTVPGTKLTVMLRVDEQTGPRTEDEASRLAHAVVCSHLGFPEKYKILDRTFASVKTARDCIPQHGVGHRARMAAAHAQLLSGYGGRLAVAGTSYTAPGLLPAMRAGRDIAAEVAGRGYETAYARRLAVRPEWRILIVYDGDLSFDPVKEGPVGVGDTGLARFRDDQTWASDFFPYHEKGVLFPDNRGKLVRFDFDRH